MRGGPTVMCDLLLWPTERDGLPGHWWLTNDGTRWTWIGGDLEGHPQNAKPADTFSLELHRGASLRDAVAFSLGYEFALRVIESGADGV